MAWYNDLWEGVKGVASTVSNVVGDVGDALGGWSNVGDVVGAGTQLAGTLMQGSAQKDQAKAQEQAAKISAQAQLAAAQAQKGELYQQATDIEETARRQQVAAALRAAQIRSAGLTQAQQANAGYAASGVVSGAGSAGAAQRSIVGSAQADAYTTMMNAQDTIATLNAQAAANRRHGDVVLAAGQYAQKEGTAAAVAASQAVSSASWANTLLGIGNVATNWLKVGS